MELDFTETDELRDFVTVPEGTYLCRVEMVQPGTTRNGHPRWGLRLVVAEGEFVGRQAAWDGLVFTERGLPRARQVLSALGIACSGRVEIEPADLIGRSALVAVRPQETEDPLTGQRVRRNEVPYDGYRSSEPTEAVMPPPLDSARDAAAQDDLPF
ncbi:MAG: hypothetical protein ACO4CZ_02280 [Planctomycetota bacterium]